MSKYTIFFERFSNRPLARWELDVIAALEYIGQHGDNHRIVLVDPPGYDSRKLLCEYYSYIHHRIDSYGNFLVMAKTKRDAATLSGFISKSKTPWLTPASGNHPDNIRGLTFNYALLLDCQAYIAKTPKSANRSHSANNSTFKIQHSKFAEALRAVAPIILNKGPDNFIIIHIRNEFTNQYSTCNINDWIPPIYIRDQLVPVPPLIYERLPGGPQLYYLTLNASPPTSTLNPQPSTLNSLLITLNPKLSTLHPL